MSDVIERADVTNATSTTVKALNSGGRPPYHGCHIAAGGPHHHLVGGKVRDQERPPGRVPHNDSGSRHTTYPVVVWECEKKPSDRGTQHWSRPSEDCRLADEKAGSGFEHRPCGRGRPTARLQ
jgi:hypothetical protein